MAVCRRFVLAEKAIVFSIELMWSGCEPNGKLNQVSNREWQARNAKAQVQAGLAKKKEGKWQTQITTSNDKIKPTVTATYLLRRLRRLTYRCPKRRIRGNRQKHYPLARAKLITRQGTKRQREAMSRRRYISTEVSLDARINRLAMDAGDFPTLLYTWMIPHAEDDASITADPEELLFRVFPGRRDKSSEDIATATARMIDLHLLTPKIVA